MNVFGEESAGTLCGSMMGNHVMTLETLGFQFVNCVSNEKQDSKAAHNNVIDVCTLHSDTPLKKVPKLGLVHRSAR